MKPKTMIAALAGLMMAGTAVAPALAQDEEVILRLLPRHTDAHVENFNPFNLSGPNGYVQDFAYEPLWIDNLWDPENDYPALATGFEIAEDLTSVTYFLREGVQWSDGEDFDADDVVFTFEYARLHPDFPMGINVYDEAADTGTIVSVDRIDDHTVRFNLIRPDALARYGIGGIYPLPEHIWSEVDDPRAFDSNPIVATGPWTEVRDFSRSAFSLCRNQYSRYDADNQIDCLMFPQLSGNEQTMAAISVGDLDWLGDGMTDPEITYTPRSEHNHYWLPPGADVNLQLNTTRAPFDNVEFRRAMSVAIDRDALLDIATFGLTTATRFPIGTGEMFAAWYDEEALAEYEWLMQYDPDLAMQMLDDAGFVDTDGDGWRETPDGEPISFGIAMPAGWTDWVNTGQFVAENLQDVGINARLQTMDEGAWHAAVQPGDFDVYVMWTNSGPTPHSQYSVMFNPRLMEEGRLDYQAMHQFRSPEAVEANERFASTSDPDEQRAALTEVHRIVAENVPVISLFANPSWYQYSTRRFEGWVTEDDPRHRPVVHGGTRERVIHALSLQPVDND